MWVTEILNICHCVWEKCRKIYFSVKEIDLVEWKGNILAVGVTEEDMAKDENLKFQNSILKILDSHLGGLLAEASLKSACLASVWHQRNFD